MQSYPGQDIHPRRFLVLYRIITPMVNALLGCLGHINTPKRFIMTLLATTHRRALKIHLKDIEMTHGSDHWYFITCK